MHTRNIAARTEAARRRITTAAAALADQLNLAPLGAVTPVEWRTPGVGPLRELEIVADLLDRVATALGDQTRGNTE